MGNGANGMRMRRQEASIPTKSHSEPTKKPCKRCCKGITFALSP